MFNFKLILLTNFVPYLAKISTMDKAFRSTSEWYRILNTIDYEQLAFIRSCR